SDAQFAHELPPAREESLRAFVPRFFARVHAAGRRAGGRRVPRRSPCSPGRRDVAFRRGPWGLSPCLNIVTLQLMGAAVAYDGTLQSLFLFGPRYIGQVK